jgi:ArsR family transcriptional regulator, cadmium/lead-responsive transcriptional repressor
MMLQAGLDAVAMQAKLFRGLADPSRLSLLHALRAGPKTVGELVATTGLSQPNASNHLACLRECALVRAQPDGRHVRYTLSNRKIARLLDNSQSLLADVAQEIYDCVNYEAKPNG